jgi:hypothetical protein
MIVHSYCVRKLAGSFDISSVFMWSIPLPHKTHLKKHGRGLNITE